MTKQFFLRQLSEEATGADAQIARDLADTLEANRATCVGMATNIVGERKRSDIISEIALTYHGKLGNTCKLLSCYRKINSDASSKTG